MKHYDAMELNLKMLLLCNVNCSYWGIKDIRIIPTLGQSVPYGALSAKRHAAFPYRPTTNTFL
jgi:hypothetical protein